MYISVWSGVGIRIHISVYSFDPSTLFKKYLFLPTLHPYLCQKSNECTYASFGSLEANTKTELEEKRFIKDKCKGEKDT